MNSILLKPLSLQETEKRAEEAKETSFSAAAAGRRTNQKEKDRQEPLVCFCVEKDAYRIRARESGRFVLEGGDCCALFCADNSVRLHDGGETSLLVKQDETLLLRFSSDKETPSVPRVSLLPEAEEWISAALTRKGERDVISFSVLGRENTFFSLGVAVGRHERVLCGRFDGEGRARLSLTVPKADMKRWTVERPSMYEVTAELMEDCSGRKRQRFLLGLAAYERRKTRNGQLLFKGKEPLRLLGLFVSPPLSLSVTRMRAAGVSLLVCPATTVTEALLSECDAVGMGVAASVTVEKDASPASLSLAAERLCALKQKHPSLLYMTLLYGPCAARAEDTAEKTLDALLTHYGSQMGLLPLRKSTESAFYTDLPFSFSERLAGKLLSERYGWDKDTYRAWYYKGLASAFFALGGQYLLLPAFMQSERGMKLLKSARTVGFRKPVFLVPSDEETALPVYTGKDLTGASFLYSLARDGGITAEGVGTVADDLPAARFSFPAVEEPTAYTLCLTVQHEEQVYKTETAIVVLPKANTSAATLIEGLSLGESRLGETTVFARAENSFFLLPENKSLPPLVSFSSPLATLSFEAQSLAPLLKNEHGRCVAALAKDGSFIVNSLLWRENLTQTDKNEEKAKGKYDFFENFF